MRPFLLVGCGGSGGATLQFLLDQLTADLSLRGVDAVPEAWQFLHIDVPVAADGVGTGRSPVVATYRNGEYVGLAPQAGAYPTVAQALAQQLLAAGEYGRLATWHADPAKVNVPISVGAGQKRAVGRVVTLARLQQVRQGLTAAYTRIKAPGVKEELRAVTRQVSPGTESLVDMPPVVLVVSSMAGGAGASMVLDVCRVLSQQEGVDPSGIALFLYTPEVFEGLARDDRAGVPGNALAMTGEIVATQVGAATDDDRALFRAVGLGEGLSSRTKPFGRVFPIGAKIGNSGTAFGGGELSQIYRGVGKGLAALMLSGEATNRWVAFDMANGSALDVDNTAFGWGADKADLAWGCFGFAQLSMGRDRYAEYAAQRVARAAVGRLVWGHRQPGDPSTDQEQRDRLVSERLPSFLAEMGLPAAGRLQEWFQQRFADVSHASARVLVERHVERELAVAAGTPAQQWLQALGVRMSQAAPAVNGDAKQEAYRHVYAWYERTVPAVERAVAGAVGTYGLPAATELLARVVASFSTTVSEMAVGARQLAADATQVKPEYVAGATAVKGAVDARSGVVEVVRSGYLDSCYRAVFGHVAATLADVLSAMRGELLEPLRAACGDATATLEAAVASDARAGSAVQLRTDEFAQWPAEGAGVPDRFTHAQNEVLLIDAGLFPAQFDAHVLRTMDLHERPVATPSDALSLAAREVVLHQWPTTGGQRDGDLLEVRSRWRPSALAADPGGSEVVPARRGAYRLRVATADVLGRAREWVARPGQPLQAYTSTSLRDYVIAKDVGDAERATRVSEVGRRFRETLELAQPLVAVNGTLVQQLHGAEARVAYKFSEVPFQDVGVVDGMRQYLSQAGAHEVSATNLEHALRGTSSATRIDVFGSYVPMSPMVFSSLLGPLAKGWDEAVLPGARLGFWDYRRSRRLRGAVPMGDVQRRACVAGFYTARLTGRLRLPGEVAGVQAVEVWDDQARDWVPFPSPLIVPPSELDRTPNNYVPAVLLSYVLAMAQVAARHDLSPLRPYTLLRRCWDASDQEAIELRDDDDLRRLDATRRLHAHLTQRDLPPGAPRPYDAPLSGDPSLDRKVLLERLERIRDKVAEDYLAPGNGGPATAGRWAVVRQPQDLWAVPLFHEVAADVHWATSQLCRVVEKGLGDQDEGVFV